MRKAPIREKIFSLFLHNIKSSGHGDVIIRSGLGLMSPRDFSAADLFDMVFIDGDHAYSSVARDIRDYAPLVVDGGYICGDDLELQERILNFK
jgi:predicted O-methyltransferase YrrM